MQNDDYINLQKKETATEAAFFEYNLNCEENYLNGNGKDLHPHFHFPL